LCSALIAVASAYPHSRLQTLEDALIAETIRPANLGVTQTTGGALIETGVNGPDNHILRGNALVVPIIDDPFAEVPEVEDELGKIAEVLTYQPPAADLPPAAPVGKIDILEILDADEIAKKNQLAAKLAKKKGKREAAAKVRNAQKAKELAEKAAKDAVIFKQTLLANRKQGEATRKLHLDGANKVLAAAKAITTKNCDVKDKKCNEAQTKAKADAEVTKAFVGNLSKCKAGDFQCVQEATKVIPPVIGAASGAAPSKDKKADGQAKKL